MWHSHWRIHCIPYAEPSRLESRRCDGHQPPPTAQLDASTNGVDGSSIFIYLLHTRRRINLSPLWPPLPSSHHLSSRAQLPPPSSIHHTGQLPHMHKVCLFQRCNPAANYGIKWAALHGDFRILRSVRNSDFARTTLQLLPFASPSSSALHSIVIHTRPRNPMPRRRQRNCLAPSHNHFERCPAHASSSAKIVSGECALDTRTTLTNAANGPYRA